MESRIQEITAVRITIERPKLARDEKSVQKIFEVLEKCTIPCECMAINIDWLAIVVRESEREKIDGFIKMLEQEMSGTKISINGDVMLLYLENGQFNSRRIGMIASSLSLQGIDIQMQRYLKCEDRLVIGVSVEDVEMAYKIVARILASNYQI